VYVYVYVLGLETMRTHFRALNDKKLCILGLTSILRTPKEQLPGSIHQGFGQLLAGRVAPMCVCVCVCVCACVCVCLYAFLFLSLSLSLSLSHTHTHTHTHIDIDRYIYEILGLV
jgi:hypothetical protein